MSTSHAVERRTLHVPMESAPVVWFVGDWGARHGASEFAGVREGFEAYSRPPHFESFATLADADAAASAALPPEVLLLAQPRPGRFEQSEVDGFHATAPLTRIVIVAGSWCEGEQRTGRPLEGALRLYWHELPAWWRRNYAARVAGLTPGWSRPADFSSGLRDVTSILPAGVASPMVVAVDAIDIATFEMLADALRPAGVHCIWSPRGHGDVGGASGAIFDGGQLEPAECQALAAFCKRLGKTAPIIALLDYPRAESIEQARALGAAAVLGKPYSLASLVAELTRPVQPPALPGGSAPPRG